MATTDDDEPREYASSPCYQHEFDDLLPTIDDPVLHEDLQDMRDTHVRNIEICAKYLED